MNCLFHIRKQNIFATCDEMSLKFGDKELM